MKKPASAAAERWSGLAAPAVAAATVHSTAPWYYLFGPVLVIAVGFAFRRFRRGGRRAGRARAGLDRKMRGYI